MCDPSTAIALGGAASAGGSILGGQSANAGYREQADQVQLDARTKAMAIRRLAKETMSGARADYAAAGVDVNSGTPTVVGKAISHNSEVDALNAIASGDAAARSLRKSGAAANNAGLMGAASSALAAYGTYALLAA